MKHKTNSTTLDPTARERFIEAFRAFRRGDFDIQSTDPRTRNALLYIVSARVMEILPANAETRNAMRIQLVRLLKSSNIVERNAGLAIFRQHFPKRFLPTWAKSESDR